MRTSFVPSTINALLSTKLSELFVLDRLRRERNLIRALEKDSLARLRGLNHKIAWEVRQHREET